ncbi:MAG: YraN family protein [Candidatus Berkelbacteria bacterium]|nr:YraN family protein [Candidatus Berkelbacteria bacterium]
MYNKKDNKVTGNAGEDYATSYLLQKGYKILGRNLSFPFGEIDILAEKQKVVVIVEVKTVKGSGFGLAQDLVRFAKQNKLRLLARAIEQKYSGRAIRIDVIGVDYSQHVPRIEHIENAVEG